MGDIQLTPRYDDKPLTDFPKNAIVIGHLSVLHAIRHGVVATNSSKKLKAAL